MHPALSCHQRIMQLHRTHDPPVLRQQVIVCNEFLHEERETACQFRFHGDAPGWLAYWALLGPFRIRLEPGKTHDVSISLYQIIQGTAHGCALPIAMENAPGIFHRHVVLPENGLITPQNPNSHSPTIPHFQTHLHINHIKEP